MTVRGGPARRALRVQDLKHLEKVTSDLAEGSFRVLGSFAGRFDLARYACVAQIVALLAGWVAFALTAGNPVAAVVLAFTQGMLSFAVGSTLISQALYAATEAPTPAEP